MAKKLVISDSVVELVRDLFEEKGFSVAAISKRTGINSINKIYAIIGKYKLKRRDWIQLPEDPDEQFKIISKEFKKLSMRQISVKYGLHPDLVPGRVSQKKRYRKAYLRGTLYQKKRLHLKIKKLVKKGFTKTEIQNRCEIGEFQLNTILKGEGLTVRTDDYRSKVMTNKTINRDKIVKQYSTGLFSLTDLSIEHKISISTVGYIVRDAGLNTVYPLKGDQLARYAKLQHLLDADWTLEQIGEYFIMYPYEVSKMIDRWEKRKEQISKGTIHRSNIMPVETFREILKLLEEGITGAEIGRRTGYTRSMICSIKRGRIQHPDVVQ